MALVGTGTFTFEKTTQYVSTIAKSANEDDENATTTSDNHPAAAGNLIPRPGAPSRGHRPNYIHLADVPVESDYDVRSLPDHGRRSCTVFMLTPCPNLGAEGRTILRCARPHRLLPVDGDVWSCRRSLRLPGHRPPRFLFTRSQHRTEGTIGVSMVARGSLPQGRKRVHICTSLYYPRPGSA